MITSETPYKLAEIIRDTWPNLYRKPQMVYNKEKNRMMKKYNSEDYFSVIEIKTGRKIVDCGEEADALAMVAFAPQNRTITRNKFMMGQVVDIEIPKELPTSNISINSKPFKDHQGNSVIEKNNQLPQIKLPKAEGEPVIV